MAVRAVAFWLVLNLAWAGLAADDQICKPDGEGLRICAGDLQSTESEISSLLQRKRSHSNAPVHRGCPLTGLTVEALHNAVMSVFGGLFTDFQLQHTGVSKVFHMGGKCSANCSVEASLNVTGLSDLRMTGFSCNGGECLNTDLFGVCSKYQVSADVSFKATRFSIAGSGDADAHFKGHCHLLNMLPDVPHFESSLTLVKPKVDMKFSVDMTLVPPAIHGPTFTPIGISYESLEGFDCGIRWLPTLNSICGDFVDRILDDAKDMILKLVNKQIQDPAEQEEISKALKAAMKDAA